jgi:HAD superfamily hydrolase (TIGR01509 family)
MSKITTIFIDDGGVMNNNTLRGPEWRRLVGEYFAPRLGGSTEAWSVANRVVFTHLESMLIAGPGQQDYVSWFDGYQIRWLKEMAAQVGVKVPKDDGECLEMVWDSVDYITHHVHSAFPGATESVKLLHAAGFTLFTSSGEHSRQLDGHLKCMGIRDCFKTLYGSDLVNCGKYSIVFYKRIFKHSGVNPIEALVVDDKTDYLTWAANLGAKTCLVAAHLNKKAEVDLVISKLADLPAALETWK